MDAGRASRAAMLIARPTDAQKEAGNYKKHHISFQGIPVSIENPKGSMRSGKDSSGRSWQVRMPYDYGYIKRTEGADGDHVDVCIGPDENSNAVFVVDQKDARTGKFDEHKLMLGYPTQEAATNAYIAGFSDGKGRDRMGHVARMTVAELKKWLTTDGTKRATRSQSNVDRALAILARR